MGSFKFHEEILSKLNKEKLESILDYSIKEIRKNIVIFPKTKNTFELDLFVIGLNQEQTILEIKSSNKLKSKFFKQLKKFEFYFPNADVYLVYSNDGIDSNNLNFEYFPHLKPTIIQYY